jgi:hypothetical protein
VPEFKGTAQHEEPADPGTGTTQAIAYLPGLEIEITHRRAAEGEAEHISINLKAVPSFEAFGRAFGAANPFALWMRSVELVWLPWIEASRAMALPWTQAPSLAPPDSEAGSERKDNAPG